MTTFNRQRFPLADPQLRDADVTRVCPPRQRDRTQRTAIHPDHARTRIVPIPPAEHWTDPGETAATRLVRVNPISGEIISDEAQETTTDISTDDTVMRTGQAPDGATAADLTIAQPMAALIQKKPTADNVVFVPAHQHRAEGECTARWNPGKVRIHSIRQWFSRHRVRVSILAIVFLCAIIIPLATLQANISPAPPVIPENPRELQDETESAKNAITEKSPTPVSPSQAATFIINGKYENARAAYRYLSSAHPENQAYSIAEDILENREDYQ
jgi:hypothetical protein